MGLVDRFDETLLLIADLVGLQHVLHRPTNVATDRQHASSSPAVSGRLGCDMSSDCAAQIARLAPVDYLIYSEASAAFDTPMHQELD